MPDNPFDLNKLNALLALAGLKHYNITIHKQLDSTQSYALEHIEKFSDNSVIVCETQVAGVGRNGKVWTSRPYTDIMVSFVHEFPFEFEYELLPLVIAVALNRLFKYLRVATKIKWPNDIYLPDKTKIAGILQSARVLENKRCIITGIGLNNIANWERNNLLVELIHQINNVLSQYKVFGFTALHQEWLDNCIHHRKMISLYKGNKLLDRGIHIDLSQTGKIRIKDQNSGSVREYSGSAISLIIEDLHGDDNSNCTF